MRSYPGILLFICLVPAFNLSATNSPVQTENLDKQNTLSFPVEEGTNFSVSKSPNGNYLAIDLQGHIWVLPANGGEATRITGPIGESRFPSWSPDSQKIAFQRYLHGQWHIWIVKADGKNLRQITYGKNDDREPIWRSDGQRIIFASDRSGSFDLWEVKIDEYNKSYPLPLTQSTFDNYFPAVSGNNARIAFVSARKRKHGMFLQENNKQSRLIFEASTPIFFPSWSPDAQRLAFVTYDKNTASSALKIADIASGKVDIISTPGEDVFISRPSWSSDTEIIYSSNGIIRKRTIGSGVENIPFSAQFSVSPAPHYIPKQHGFRSKRERPVLGLMTPAPSPDGNRVAFIALGDLWILEVGKVTPQRITNDAFLEIEPAWSPDGLKLVYLSDRRGIGTMDLYSRDVKTGLEERLTNTEDNLSMPSFSPDGSKIALYMTDSVLWKSKIPHILDLESGELTKIHGPLFKPGIPSWSPDSGKLAIVVHATKSKRYRKGLNKILFLSVDGLQQQIDSPTPQRSLGIRAKNGAMWSPDGKYIAYVQGGCLWIIAVDKTGRFTGKPRRLTEIIADHARWTADSASLVFQSVDTLKRVYLDDGRIEDIAFELMWQPAIPEGRKVLRAGRLFDAVSDNYRNNVDIIIDENVITDIVPAGAVWKDVEFIDASDKTVMPGMTESHVHNFSVNGELTGRVALSYGMTSLREPGADPHEALEAKESWASGRRLGPRLFTSALIEGPYVYYGMSLPVDTPAYLELELERAKRLNYDFIKTYERLDDDMFKRTTEFAHNIGISISSHELYPAALFGADAVEHMSTRDRLAFSDRLSPGGHVYEDVIKLLKKSGMTICPTAFGFSPVEGAAFLDKKGKSLLDVKQYKALVPDRYFQKGWLQTAVKKDFSRRPLIRNAALKANILKLARAGVPLAIGTDTSFFNIGFGSIIEMQHFLEAGLSHAQVLKAATIEPARMLGVDKDLGTIEKGKLADMIVIDGDPLVDIFDLLNIELVFKDGNKYTLKELLRAPGS